MRNAQQISRTSPSFCGEPNIVHGAYFSGRFSRVPPKLLEKPDLCSDPIPGDNAKVKCHFCRGRGKIQGLGGGAQHLQIVAGSHLQKNGSRSTWVAPLWCRRPKPGWVQSHRTGTVRLFSWLGGTMKDVEVRAPEAEALACAKGMKWPVQWDVSQVIIETDYAQLSLQ